MVRNTAPEVTGSAALAPRRLAWLVPLVVYQLVYLISYVDRQILSLVVGPIKRDLNLSDMQIGFLQGIAFAMVLAFAGLITAKRVDTGNRTRIVGICVVLWCSMTVACGLSQNFWGLFAARTGLAIAEAVVPVAVLSIICDVAPRAMVPRLVPAFNAAPYVGGGLALFLGGPILASLTPFAGRVLPIAGEFQPWRGLFWALGAPGILLGLVLLIVMREPPRRALGPQASATERALPFLRQHAKFLLILMTFLGSLHSINMAIYGWAPTYMIRVHGMDAATVGLTVGPLLAASGIAGSALASWVMGLGAPSHALSHVVRTMVGLMAFFTLPLLVLPLAPSPPIALAALAIGLTLLSAVMTSALTVIQLFAPSQIRGRVTAVSSIYMTVAGGLGPLAVGVVTEFGFRAPQKIHYSMAVCFASALALAWLTGPIAARTARRIDDSGMLRVE